MIEIPLNSSPEQLFNIVISETKYDLRVILNSRTGVWSLSISSQGDDLVSGIALLPGVDILEPYNLGIGRGYVVNLENPNRNPSKTGLGVSSRLFILSEEEVQDATAI